jgi:hypothetical protein
MVGELLRFRIDHHSLHLFGKCNELLESGNCKHKIKK